jgi:predicted CXXCH cytochrome family protein
MFALVRQLREGPGVCEYADTELTGDVITIGSAPDRDIQLLGRGVAADHAVIRRSGGTLGIVARGGTLLQINGIARSAAPLSSGDTIDIGGNIITMLPPPAGFDLALAVQPNADVKKSEFESAFRTDLEQTWLSKRTASWSLLLLTAVLAFAVPLATAVVHRQGRDTAVWVPDDTFWSAGPLIPAHAQAAGRRCELCHQSFFSHTRDQDCRKCHTRIGDHISPAHLALTTLGPTARCGTCHEEHNATAGSLVIGSDALCTGCHANARARFGPLQVDAVSGFAAGTHPDFKATVPVPASLARGMGALHEERSAVAAAALKPTSAAIAFAHGVAQVDWQLVRVPATGGHEYSNLKFSHAQHLDGNKVQRASDSKPLGCGDCHVLAADGEHFTPITMASVCSGCHELTFDEKAPDRQLPHGKPRDSILLIEDYYARKFADPTMSSDAVARRRLPDNPKDDEVCTAAPFVCAMRRAALEIDNQFTRRGCVSCHVVTDNRAADVHERFEVLPVRLTRDYFTDVHFNHRQHAVQKDLTGDAACLSCHKARDSTDVRNLMLPDLGKCLECHGDSGARDRIITPCAGCHAYHSQP